MSNSRFSFNTFTKLSALLSLAVVVLTGIVMRFQFGGLNHEFFNNLDLRQAHSHLGFYGFIIPITWMINEIYQESYRQKLIIKFYFLIVALSFFAFIISGYSWPSHALSALVFATWIYQNSNLKDSDLGFKKYMHMSSILAVCSLALVILGRKFFPETPKINFVHGFVSNIILMIVLPSLIKKIYGKLTLGLWLLGTILNYLFEVQLLTFFGFNIGIIILGSHILYLSYCFEQKGSFLKNLKDDIYIKLMPAGMVFSGVFSAITGYNFKIASLHFFFLTIFSTYFFKKILNYRFSNLFSHISFLMCCLIASLDISGTWYTTIQITIALTGLLIFSNILHVVFCAKTLD